MFEEYKKFAGRFKVINMHYWDPTNYNSVENMSVLPELYAPKYLSREQKEMVYKSQLHIDMLLHAVTQGTAWSINAAYKWFNKPEEHQNDDRTDPTDPVYQYFDREGAIKNTKTPMAAEFDIIRNG